MNDEMRSAMKDCLSNRGFDCFNTRSRKGWFNDSGSENISGKGKRILDQLFLEFDDTECGVAGD
jgi:hypothetical protein